MSSLDLKMKILEAETQDMFRVLDELASRVAKLESSVQYKKLSKLILEKTNDN